MFKMSSFTIVDPERQGDYFRKVCIPRLYFSAHNLRHNCGHKRVFGDQPGKGWTFYEYGRQSYGDDWAMHRRWNFVLFCIHHVGKGKATDPQGWNITFTKFIFKREHQGFSFHCRKANTFRIRK